MIEKELKETKEIAKTHFPYFLYIPHFLDVN